MKPLVGLIPLFDDGRDSYWMLPGYMKMLEENGALPIMLPLTEDTEVLHQAANMCDGFLLTGGHDISPELYGAAYSEKCGTVCAVRDGMEQFILSHAIKSDKPVLGICRGIQMINVYLGGTLYQDLPSEYNSTTEHCMKPPYSRAVHKVKITENTLLYEILHETDISVNSYHHQAIKEAAQGLEVMAVSEDGLIEAVSVRGKRFIAGVQWHPEFLYKTDANSNKIIRGFVMSMEEGI